jgi:serine/threonine protein kinase/formylglycine-generating enzyme required for sulfatase activity
MSIRSHRPVLIGSSDAVAALRLEQPSPPAPPSGTAQTERPPRSVAPPSAAVPGVPIQSGPMSAWRPPPVFDEYRLIELVGRGGMGEVYLAHDEILDRQVAVKVISGIDPDPAARDRFMLEARAAARLQHPNVLTIYRVGELDGRPYLITEFIRGKTLDRLAKPVPWRRALSLGVGLSRGLAAAHRRGVLHRDIKPGNAILPDEGEVKLLDFGLAKLLDGSAPPATWRSPAPAPVAPSDPSPASRKGGSTLVSLRLDEAPAGAPEAPRSLTDAGSLMGTPDYMAPEIWRGEPATRRSDVYALGALLFELCAGYPPHRDVPPRALAQQVQKRVPPLVTEIEASVSPKLAAVIERCLARDPADRYASGDELREALEQLELTSRTGHIPEGNPYRGLHTFEAEHRGLFFGRRAEIGTLLERLRVEPLVIVAGDSGVGKSSLCRAGVLPAIQEGALGGGRAWSVLRFVPGRSPLLSLGAALAPLLGMDESAVVRRLRAHPSAIARTIRKRLGDTAGLVLFVDQLEELVTMSETGGAGTAAEALGHLAQGLPGVRVLSTVRSDFLAPVAAQPGLGDEIARALYFLKPLSPDGVRAAITGPARVTGVSFESEALVETLVSSTSQAEGGLPLLQFALAELWEARDQAAGAITAAALSTIGGVAGALARHADEVILAMTAVQRSAARRILFALVSPQGTPVRRREDEIVAGDPAARAALNGLVRGRLLVVRDNEQGATYELAHEALLRGWATLRRWIDEQADSRAVRQRLAAASMEWERLGRAREALWSPRQLAELDGVVDPDDLLPRETAFVTASRRSMRHDKFFQKLRWAAAPLALLGIFVGVRIQSEGEHARRIAVRVGQAEGILAEARRAADDSAALRGEAFARFDAFQRDEGEAAWAQARTLSARADHDYGHASQVLETALVDDAGNPRVQALVGDVLFARALLAEREHHLEQRDELIQRLPPYDADGTRRQQLAAPAEMAIQSNPPGARVSLGRYMEDDRKARRLAEVGELGPTPVASVVLAPGSYLLTLTMPGRVAARYPILLARAERLRLDIPLPVASRVPAGFAYVPAGRFLFGSAAEETGRSFYNTPPLHETVTGAFLIARHEVTYDEWLTFLRAQPPDERVRRAPHVASLTGAIELKELSGDAWQLSLQPTRHAYAARTGEMIRYEGRTLRAVQDWLRFPVSGVSLEDAQVYVGWLDGTGRVPGARLCTEGEWERAARGADDREFPHGNRLDPDDANFDQTYGKEPLAFGPDEVGSHPASRSPFGVDDMCGNVWEWTDSSLAPNEHVLRGGGYYHDSTTARIPNRQVPEPTIHDPNLGIRVCVSFEP